MNTKEAQLFNNKNVNKYDQYTFLFLFSFIHLLAESVGILIILSQNLITTIFIVLKNSSYEESFLFAPSPMLESKQRTKYHINCEIGERLFHPMLAQDGETKSALNHTSQGFRNFRQLDLLEEHGKVTSVVSLFGALTLVFVTTLTLLDFGIILANVMV